ncbi:ribosomal RNA-processing protein 8 isoform X1 [Camellia sinensis]|uniref:ribosomal RNA-processing protein 8 isoform X1 n=1 Tax=Camellia sinensis TaxID=4442 RepID=UPI001035F673|nr:ribosomal RNA-processing protein 8 isoform X1 [Camellia sinensis]
MKEEKRSNRKRKRPRHRKPRPEKSSDNPNNDHLHQVSQKIDEHEDSASPPSRTISKSSSFLDKMRARLSGGHFRMINEKLYTCTGNDALNYFKEDPMLFNVYHTGYQEQMSHWPEQPVNVIIKWIKDHNPSFLVADFGCGDALLARNVKNKVFSFDLVSNDPSVIACDMSNTPLDSSSIDVAVFCLSLMGTNFSSYLQEAHRVVKPSGWLLIAEVKSRFDPNTGGADPDKFSKAICELGFASVSKVYSCSLVVHNNLIFPLSSLIYKHYAQDFSNKMFILLYFKKKEKQNSKREIEWPELKPCLYKRR